MLRWLDDVAEKQGAAKQQRDLHNQIAGRVHGNVVQAGTINGDVSFYGPPRRCCHCDECSQHRESG
jgi:hypothetical protein